MFALVDCNSFFASCEKVFRPKLAERPVVVLSNNDGIVVARSPEAKKLGIPMGEAFFKIKRLVQQHRVHVFSSNFELYADMSRRVMQTLRQWTPLLEIYSIDEAFLHFDGVRIDDIDALGREITRIVKQWTGIPVSVGFAETKTLAKLANETAKSRACGHCVLLDAAVRDATMQEFDIGDVWGVGRRLVVPFRKLGLRTAFDLSQVDPIWMRRNYSIVQEQLVRELRGERCWEIDDQPQPKKSIQYSRSFGETTSSWEDLEQAVATFAARAAEKSREQGTVASAVYVHVNTSPFRKDREQYRSEGTVVGFPSPTASTPEIVNAALRGLRKIFVPGLAYKKATVILLQLIDADVAGQQKFLFDKGDRSEEQRETERTLMESVDEINRRFGRGAVFFGVEGVEHDWKPHRDFHGSCFTTRAPDFPVAR